MGVPLKLDKKSDIAEIMKLPLYDVESEVDDPKEKQAIREFKEESVKLADPAVQEMIKHCKQLVTISKSVPGKYIIMEKADTSLVDLRWAKQNKLTYVDYITGIWSALLAQHYLHQKRYTHNDASMANVFRSRKTIAKNEAFVYTLGDYGRLTGPMTNDENFQKAQLEEIRDIAGFLLDQTLKGFSSPVNDVFETPKFKELEAKCAVTYTVACDLCTDGDGERKKCQCKGFGCVDKLKEVADPGALFHEILSLMPELFTQAAMLQMKNAKKNEKHYYAQNIRMNLAGLDLNEVQTEKMGRNCHCIPILDVILLRKRFSTICPFLKGIISTHPAYVPEGLKQQLIAKVKTRWKKDWTVSTLSKETYAEWRVWSAYCNPDEWMTKESNTKKFYKLCPLLNAIRLYSTTETMRMHQDFIAKIKKRYKSLWCKRSVSQQTYEAWDSWLNTIESRRRLQSGDNAPHRVYTKRLIQRFQRMGLLPTDHHKDE